MPEQIIKIRKNVPSTDSAINNELKAVHEIYANWGQFGDPTVLLANVENAIAANSFQVYTVSEINNINSAVKEEISNHFDEKVEVVKKDLEVALTDRLTLLVNGIPQKLLVEETVRVIKEAILLEIKQELNAMKQDFQAQIDALTP